MVIGDQKRIRERWKCLGDYVGLCFARLLIGFGAPFWHDFIGKLTEIRKTLMGKKEGIKDTNSQQTADDNP